MIDLGTLPGRSGSVAYFVNERGEIAGTSCDFDEEVGYVFGCRAVRWRAENGPDDEDADEGDDEGADAHASASYTIIDLGALPGKSTSFPSALNERGEIVGSSCEEAPGLSPFNCRAFLWRDGVMTDVTPISGASESFGGRLNDRGQFVVAVVAAVSRAFLWDGDGFRELCGVPGFSTVAPAINERAQVAGHSINPPRALFWSPDLDPDGEDDDEADDFRSRRENTAGPDAPG
jgi:uncharacterized membrane protein